MQSEPNGLHVFVVHCPDFFLESKDGRKFVVNEVFFQPPIAPTAMDTNPAAVGAVARLGADRSGASMLIAMRVSTS